MRISVFGLGYVGLVTTACLARDGFVVTGVDVDASKTETLAKGRTLIVEQGLAGLLAYGTRENCITATTKATQAVAETDVSLVCVGTPGSADGSQNRSYLDACCDAIADGIRAKGRPHTVIIRSTVIPGTTDELTARIRERAGEVSVYTAYNPEFLREGTAVSDYDNPPYVVAGTRDTHAETVLRDIYARVPAPFIRSAPKVAELIKFVCNAWHANKVAFANEVGRLSDVLGIDAREVMGIFCRDTKLNVSHAYLLPGFAYGGSCLPKDVRAIVHYGKSRAVNLPLLESLNESNGAQIEWAVRQVTAFGEKKVGLLGLAFKPGTDDLRDSPAIALAERLLTEGLHLRILDPIVRPSTLSPVNRRYLEARSPALLPLIVESTREVVDHATVLVLTQGTTQLADVVAVTDRDVPIVDLSRAFFRDTKA